MSSLVKNEGNHKRGTHIFNYSDEELIFKELHLKCRALETETMKMLRTRQNLIVLNKNNDNISKRLSKIKTDYEVYKSHLCKTLFNIKVSTDKQKILLRKKLNEFSEKRKTYEEYYSISPIKSELEELINMNRHLEEEWENRNNLFKLTKKQYHELLNLVIEAFKKKVCEFCDAVLRLRAVTKQVN